MKYKIIAFCLIAGVCLHPGKSSAQETNTSHVSTSPHAFENGDNVLSLGLGLGGTFGSYTYSSQTPGFSVQFEHGNWDVGGPGVISLGGYLGIKSYTYNGAEPGYTWSYKWNYTVIGVRSAYHYNGITDSKADLYGGVMLAYDILNFKYTSSNPAFDYLHNASYNSQVSFTLYVGGRYYLAERVAAFLEIGYGVSYLTLGAAFKL